eukprot:snap_masked-scaffold_17-processed-gene-5.6-mRNA-1 protein AED:1.00 eAED:1.00 QI:0/-1/0/0/-1/1/1/0/406
MPENNQPAAVKAVNKTRAYLSATFLQFIDANFKKEITDFTFIFLIAPHKEWQQIFSTFAQCSFRLGDSLIYPKITNNLQQDFSSMFNSKGLRILMFFKKARRARKFNFQKNTDIFEGVENLKASLLKVINDLTDSTKVPIERISYGQTADSKLGSQASKAVSVQRIAGVPLEEVEEEHFLKLDDSDKDIPPILISNMVDNIPEEFNEVGIGEGCISEKEEESLLLETIKNKISSSNLSASSKHLLSTLLIENKGALGLKQSNAQMSLMTPIAVTLKAGSRVLRSDGYHLAPEQEDFLELKFKALREAGIVEPVKNPVWGHPVFVVPKKMAKPDAWNGYTNDEKEKWKADNILNRFCMVCNMVRLNKITVPTSLNLPNLERQLFSIKGSRVYATLDILSGFDFLEME